jgi:hypothetical protein
MTAQYSFLSTCQQIAHEELGHFDLGPGPPALHHIGQQEQKVKKREKLLSLFGGLLPATKTNADPDGRENATDHVHDKKGTRYNFFF